MAWFYKGDLRYKSEEVGWSPYNALENQKIEKAWQAKKKTVKINNKYSVNLDSMYQYRTNDPTKQRMIKREEVSLSESDSDEPPKKKAKVDTNSLVGQSVYVVFQKEEARVIGIYANEDDAHTLAKEKTKASEDEYVVFTQRIK